MLSTFTPINSIDDVRLVTLIGVAINVIEDYGLQNDIDPETVLAKYLYIANRQVLSAGTNCYLEKLIDHYPLLNEAIN